MHQCFMFRVTSVSIYDEDTCFELQNGQIARFAHSKTVNFAEMTSLTSNIEFRFYTFEDCDNFFIELSKEKLLSNFCEDVEQAEFQHYLSINGFRRFISAVGSNLRELKLKNLLLVEPKETKDLNQLSDKHFPVYPIKDVIQAVVNKCTKLRIFT